MTRELKEILAEAMTLTENERASLAASLLESLDGDAEEEGSVDEAWQKEVERRLGQLRAGTVNTISWTELRRELLTATKRGR